MFDTLRTWLRRSLRKATPRTARALRARLEAEALEERQLLAARPFITGVVPLDGSRSPSAHPVLRITFSEQMNVTDVETERNYLLFDQLGNSVSVDLATYNNATRQVTLNYNGGADLTAGAYTLLVRGDRLNDVDPTPLAMAQAGQTIVAIGNGQGGDNVSVIGVPQNGQLGAGPNHPAPAPSQFFAGSATAIAYGNFSGATDGSSNPLPDLLIAYDDGTASVFQGRLGGGYDLQPTATVFLPTLTAAPAAIAVADFN